MAAWTSAFDSFAEKVRFFGNPPQTERRRALSKELWDYRDVVDDVILTDCWSAMLPYWSQLIDQCSLQFNVFWKYFS